METLHDASYFFSDFIVSCCGASVTQVPVITYVIITTHGYTIGSHLFFFLFFPLEVNKTKMTPGNVTAKHSHLEDFPMLEKSADSGYSFHKYIKVSVYVVSVKTLAC